MSKGGVIMGVTKRKKHALTRGHRSDSTSERSKDRAGAQKFISEGRQKEKKMDGRA